MAVFPTHVGVFLHTYTNPFHSPRLPHARGGVSQTLRFALGIVESSPRTWGCFRHVGHDKCAKGVFPTHVGVFPFSARDVERQ